jgi:hypothetical protein
MSAKYAIAPWIRRSTSLLSYISFTPRAASILTSGTVGVLHFQSD